MENRSPAISITDEDISQVHHRVDPRLTAAGADGVEKQ
jgi:hypothetical protein